jgi:hypothetical protein
MPNRSIEGNLTLIGPNDRLLWMGTPYEMNEWFHFVEECTTKVATNLVTL